MTNFLNIFDNQILFWSLIACLSAQFLKIVFYFILEGELKFGIIFETGGMPSSHSALITGVASGLGFEIGFDDPIFAFAVAISLIVMYDASGVRRSAGLNAAQINKILEKLNNQSDVSLKETLGHTKIEVFVGSIIGPLITITGMAFLGSPKNILSLLAS